MTRVRDLTFAASVATFDDPAHPQGVAVPTTEPLGTGPTFTAFAHFPDGRFGWLSSTAVWGRNGHPWALVRRFHIDGDAPADAPIRSRDPRLSGGGELTVTDDVVEGRRTLAAGRSSSRPVRVRGTAWVGDAPGDERSALGVLVEDGVTPADPATITVLDGGALPSGFTLRAEPGLAARLRDSAGGALTSATGPLSTEVTARAHRNLPARVTVAVDASPAQ